MYDNHIQSAAAQIAQTMTGSAVPIYGKQLHLPNRSAIIALLDDLRRLFFPAYFGDASLMSLPPENYACLLLESLETQLTAQISLALPEDSGVDAGTVAADFISQLPRVQALLLTDIDALFDGDPAAQNREEIIFSYPGLYAIFVYRVAHELYLRRVPIIPRIMSEYAHSRTGIDIHPGAAIGSYFFIDHGTGVVVGETTVIGNHVKLYQGVTLGALSPRKGHASLPGKRHPTVGSGVTIYSGATILGGETVIGENSVVSGNAFLTHSVPAGSRVVVQPPEASIKTPGDPFVYNI
jgi:serine O-acetyltransferase